MTETSAPAQPALLTTLPPLDPAALSARIYAQLAAELGVNTWQIKAAVELLDGGATVPFIARYRKEATGR